jgi:MFS family permease
VVRRLAGLFSLDAFAGGFIVQSFIVFWFGRQFGADAELMGLVFFGVGLLQAGSSVAAGWLGGRIGLLNTMVFTHLPSNVLLALIPFAPSLALAVVLLLARSALSQMDVPARQAYVAALVDPAERTAAAGYTNAARHLVRPAGPVMAAASMGMAAGLPFLVAGGLKVVYDLALYVTFRRVRLGDD